MIPDVIDRSIQFLYALPFILVTAGAFALWERWKR